MHQHQVYDTDNHFVIDPITKEIENRSELNKLSARVFRAFLRRNNEKNQYSGI